MENLFERLDHPILFSVGCDASQGIFEPHIRAIEADGIRVPCESNSENIISCKNPDRTVFLDEVNGLDFASVRIFQRQVELPSLVPIIDRTLFGVPGKRITSGTVGISLEDVFSSAPKRRNGEIVQSRLVLRKDVLTRPAFENKNVVLFCSGRDKTIETLWQEFHCLEFAEAIGKMGFTAVTGINFSVFFGECPFAHALNLKKSLESARLFHDAGIEVIPHVYFAHRFHLDRWIAWLKKNPSVTTVAVNCQFRSGDVVQILVQGIDYLLRNVGREMKVILEGSDPKKMRLLFRTFPKSMIVTMKGLSLSARFRNQYVYANGVISKLNRSGASFYDILNASVENYTEYVKGLSAPLISEAKHPVNRKSAPSRRRQALSVRHRSAIQSR